MAQQLIDSLSAEFDPSKFQDEYRERVLDLIERKAAGEEIAVQPQAEDEAPAPDLMAALEASLAEVRSGGERHAARARSKKPAPSRASARRRARTAVRLRRRRLELARQGQELDSRGAGR